MSRILFVINPIAGARSHHAMVDLIKPQLPDNIDAFFEVWDTIDKIETIKEKILSKTFDIVVAAGGDGTISMISKLAKEANIPLGIIPVGSGNGYARHLKIPLEINNALKVILLKKVKEIDTAKLSGHYFINIAGLGFDALISEKFSKASKRGLMMYVILVLKNIMSFKPEFYKLYFNNESWSGKAVVVDFALGTQFGNNAIISPHSDPSDGLMDVCILKPFPLYYSFMLLYRLYSNSIDKSKYFLSFKTDKAKVVLDKLSIAQYDGESCEVENEFSVEISKTKLKVIVP